MTYKIVSIYFLYQYMVDLRKKITSWIVLHSICFNTEQKKKINEYTIRLHCNEMLTINQI